MVSRFVGETSWQRHSRAPADADVQLQERTLHVAVNGQQSRNLPVGASGLQGSVLGQVLWNLYINDLLRSLAAVSANANDYTISLFYRDQGSQSAIADVIQQLGVLEMGEVLASRRRSRR